MFAMKYVYGKKSPSVFPRGIFCGISEFGAAEYTRGEKRSRKVVAGRVSCAAAGKDRDRIGYRESGRAAYRYGANQAIGFRGLRGKVRK